MEVLNSPSGIRRHVWGDDMLKLKMSRNIGPESRSCADVGTGSSVVLLQGAVS